MISSNTTEEDPKAPKKKQKVAESPRRYYGLYNQGATCYLNSVLQVLFMTPKIQDSLKEESQGTGEKLRILFENLTKVTCGTENITQSLGISDVHKQCDAAQYLEKILEKISSAASQVFRGKLKYTTTCTESHCINEEVNPFWTLPLSLKDATNETFNVERSFQEIFQPKTLSRDNMVYCSECGKKTEATRRCEMKEFPLILVLLLKKFNVDYNTMSYSESNRLVEMPDVLQRKERGDQTFKLYGIVNHMGSLKGGHYTATIWSEENKTWYEFNDSDVREVEEQPFMNKNTYESKTAYLLVYRASTGTEQDQNGFVDKEEGNKGEHPGKKRKVTHDELDMGKKMKVEEKAGPPKMTKKKAETPRVKRKMQASTGRRQNRFCHSNSTLATTHKHSLQEKGQKPVCFKS